MPGEQLGLSSGDVKVHKHVDGGTITITVGSRKKNSRDYTNLEGQNNSTIINSELFDPWYRITQTSANSNPTDVRYKYEISRDSGTSYGAAVTDQRYGDSFTDGKVTIKFGGVEIIYTPSDDSNICILQDSYVETDQGNLLIQNLTTQNTIHKMPVLHIFRSFATQPFVCIKQHSFGYNLPSQDTYLSNNHSLNVLYYRDIV